MISLLEAIKEGRVPDFIAQEEARGIGPIPCADFAALTAALVKAPQSEDQTSHSSSDDSLTGKKTRQGTGPCAER